MSNTPSNFSTRSLIGYFLKAYPRQSALIVPPLLIAGVAESVTIIALLPLLEVALGTGSEGEGSTLSRLVNEFFATFNLSPTLSLLVAVVVFVMLGRAIILWIALYQVGRIVTLVATDLRQQMLRVLMQARWRYFTSQPVGHFANAISSEVHSMTHTFRAACYTLAAVIHVALYLVLLLLVSWQATIVALLAGMIVMLALRRLFRVTRAAGRQRAAAMKSLVGQLTSTLSGLKSLKAMGQERRVWPFLDREVEAYSAAHLRAIMAYESLRAFYEPIFVALIGVGFFVAIRYGSMEVTTLLLLAALLYRLMTHVGQMQEHLQTLVVGEGAFVSFRTQMESAEAALEPTGDQPAPSVSEHICFDHVSFAYEDDAILRDVSFRILPRQIVAFVGASGAGKTTLADLLVGLLHPQAGQILIDGVPLRSLDLARWRAQIGYVPQDPLLFNDTIYNNIALGEATRSEVETALRAAGAWEFVRQSPDGMDRNVGERGMQLSGGQRQRISIARALVHRPKLLILDEATTALDPKTEQEICDTLLDLRTEMTIVAISHQTAIQRIADHVLHVGAGHVRTNDEALQLA